MRCRETGWSASGSNAAASDATPENQLVRKIRM